MERRLAAILAADVVGYSRLMGEDEVGTLARLKAHRAALIDPKVAEHHGRIVKLMGDGALVEFASVVDAVQCAVEIQRVMAERNAEATEDRRIEFRVGINLGDVIADGEDIYGDGVNIAARLEGLAEPGGICISGTAFDQVKNKLGLGFEFLGEQEVKNIAEPVRVYRVLMEPEAAGKIVEAEKPRAPWWRWAAAAAVLFALAAGGAVALWLRPWAPDVEPASIERMAFPLPDKPSIAVLAFDNLSGDAEKDYLADGLSENIITELSRFRELFVIARKSSFAYKGKPVTVQQVAEELGVRYVLEGSMQTAGDRVRVTAQLIDATSGKHLWAEDYDRDLQDIFAVQDEITRTIVATLEENIKLAERARALRTPTKSLKAYEYEKRAQVSGLKWTKEGNEEARRLAQKSLELDPNYPEAYIRLAWVHINGFRWGWSDTHSREESLRLALEMSKKAVELDPRSHRARQMLANALMQSSDLEQAIAEYDRALELNPSSASVLADAAEPLVYLGRAEEAIARIKMAIRLNPHHPDWYLWNLGWAQYFAEEYEEALASLRRMNKMPNMARISLASIYVRLGRIDEARAVITEFVQNAPDYTLKDYKLRTGVKFKHQAYLDRRIEDLRTAGLPEHPPLKLPDKPSIAVLPFDNLSDDPEQSYFADGITEDLITDLSKISGLFVIARNSTFAYRGKSPDARRVARELGVRYVLEGSVRRAGNQMRINARLIDATTEGHLWAERYDGKVTDVFAFQDKVTRKIVSAFAVTLTADESEAVAHRETNNLAAYDAFLQGWAHYVRDRPEAFLEAIPYFEKAIKLDPNYGRAYAALAAIYYETRARRWYARMGLDYVESFRLAYEHLDKAKGNPSALAHAVASRMRIDNNEHDKAIAEAEQAIALDPNDPSAMQQMAYTLIMSGQPDRAIDYVKRAMRFDPGSRPKYSWTLGLALFSLEHFAAAVPELEAAADNSPDEMTLAPLAAAYGHLGRNEKASRVVEAMEDWKREWLPGYPVTVRRVMNWYVFKDAADADLLIEGLRKAGLR